MENAVLNDSTGKAIEDLWNLWSENDRRRESPPAGSRSIKQHAEIKKIPEKTASGHLRAGESAGELESQVYMINGHLTRFFWPVKRCPESTPSTNGRIGKKRRISG